MLMVSLVNPFWGYIPGTLSLIILLCLMTDDFARHEEGKHNHSTGQKTGGSHCGYLKWAYNPSFVNPIPKKNLSKVVKSQNLVEKCCNVQKI